MQEGKTAKTSGTCRELSSSLCSMDAEGTTKPMALIETIHGGILRDLSPGQLHELCMIQPGDKGVFWQ